MKKIKSLVLMNLFLGMSFVAKADPTDDKILKSYLSIATDLANDSSQSIVLQAKEIFDTIQAQKDKKDIDLYKKIASAAQSVSLAKDIDETRNKFQNLSDEMKSWFEKEKPATVDVMFCPMKKAHWLQKAGDTTQNPYFGKSMSSCGYSVTKKMK